MGLSISFGARTAVMQLDDGGGTISATSICLKLKMMTCSRLPLLRLI